MPAEKLTRLYENVRKLQRKIAARGLAVPPARRREAIRALERLRKALNQAILALEKRIAGGGKASGGARRK